MAMTTNYERASMYGLYYKRHKKAKALARKNKKRAKSKPKSKFVSS